MPAVKRIVLDVLKPHEPNALDFSRRLAASGKDYRVYLMVLEVDEKTETLQVEVQGTDIQCDSLFSVIKEMGGSLHSIDEVDVFSDEQP
ncbi:DUF211 domain-containing protein [Aliiglaciecola sp. CAU 1673]|uniref:DUF211 domain-containing protein n=1 Tax=Aliiglaciecola sp. CAU 1673 TaxID=3032595 RepID=UPI0023DAEE02|nr:DUF211 domain-containing protein [Aliiglaciecola sp. CAU 1673]MDF2177622.1 DUF211 domain-containing protein [Aliiglaciecola sp. CAU 1673]